MSALTLEQLLKLANLSADVKQNALANIPKMNEDQKARLSQVCWENIARRYEAKAQLEYDHMLEEMANGEKQYSPQDFTLIEERMISGMLAEIDNVKSKDQIQEVKEGIQQYVVKLPPKTG